MSLGRHAAACTAIGRGEPAILVAPRYQSPGSLGSCTASIGGVEATLVGSPRMPSLSLGSYSRGSMDSLRSSLLSSASFSYGSDYDSDEEKSYLTPEVKGQIEGIKAITTINVAKEIEARPDKAGDIIKAAIKQYPGQTVAIVTEAIEQKPDQDQINSILTMLRDGRLGVSAIERDVLPHVPEDKQEATKEHLRQLFPGVNIDGRFAL